MIGSYCKDSITLRMDKGADKWQEPLTPEDVSVKGFIDYGERRIENAQGQIITSTAKVRLRPRTIIISGFATRASNTISYKDKIIFGGSTRSIIKITNPRDFSIRCTEVYVA